VRPRRLSLYDDVLLCRLQVLGSPKFRELEGDEGTGPGTKVLGSRLFAYDLLYVGVQFARLDVLYLAFLIAALKDFVPGEGDALLDHPSASRLRRTGDGACSALPSGPTT
jgi:hypothetical protein